MVCVLHHLTRGIYQIELYQENYLYLIIIWIYFQKPHKLLYICFGSKYILNYKQTYCTNVLFNVMESLYIIS